MLGGRSCSPQSRFEVGMPIARPRGGLRTAGPSSAKGRRGRWRRPACVLGRRSQRTDRAARLARPAGPATVASHRLDDGQPDAGGGRPNLRRRSMLLPRPCPKSNVGPSTSHAGRTWSGSNLPRTARRSGPVPPGPGAGTTNVVDARIGQQRPFDLAPSSGGGARPGRSTRQRARLEGHHRQPPLRGICRGASRRLPGYLTVSEVDAVEKLARSRRPPGWKLSQAVEAL